MVRRACDQSAASVNFAMPATCVNDRFYMHLSYISFSAKDDECETVQESVKAFADLRDFDPQSLPPRRQAAHPAWPVCLQSCSIEQLHAVRPDVFERYRIGLAGLAALLQWEERIGAAKRDRVYCATSLRYPRRAGSPQANCEQIAVRGLTPGTLEKVQA